VVKHRGRTYDRDPQSVTNRRTPSSETRATAEDPPSTPDEDVDEVTLGAYGDKKLEVRSGVVVPSGHYIVIDGGDRDCQRPGDRYEAAQAFQEWCGFYTEQSITCELARSLDHSHGSPVKISR
jgi:hypothetical protein